MVPQYANECKLTAHDLIEGIVIANVLPPAVVKVNLITLLVVTISRRLWMVKRAKPLSWLRNATT